MYIEWLEYKERHQQLKLTSHSNCGSAIEQDRLFDA